LRAIGTALDDLTAGAELAAQHRATGEAERTSVATLRAIVGALEVPALQCDPSRIVAIVAVLRACGLAAPFQLSTALTIARLTSIVAETAATKVGDFKSYPMDLPHFDYDSTAAPSGKRT
jgi:hypothetical protein